MDLLQTAVCVGSMAAAACGEPADSAVEFGTAREAIVFGDDDREEVVHSNYVAKRVARSTAALTANVTCSGDTCSLQDSPFVTGAVDGAPNAPLCPGVKFANQPRIGTCTAFLVAPDLMLTAGHCVALGTRRHAVFGFQMDEQSNIATEVPAGDVYEGTVVDHQFNGEGATQFDWAVVRLDRPVRDRAPLPIEPKLTAAVGTALFGLGHGDGLALKVSPGGHLKAADAAHQRIYYNLDLFGGNSGSPIFEARSGKVIAVHNKRPASNYVATADGCTVPNVCPDLGCGGETATRHQRFSRGTRTDRLPVVIPATPGAVAAVVL